MNTNRFGLKMAPGHFVDQRPAETFAERPIVGWQRDLMALAEAMFLRDEGPPDCERLEWFARQMDDFLRHAGLRTRLVLRGSLASVALAVSTMAGRPGSLRSVSVEQRLAGLERAEKSPIALACFALKAMSCILWYEHPASAQEIDFDGRCRGDVLAGEGKA